MEQNPEPRCFSVFKGAVTFEISHWFIYKKAKIVSWQFQNIAHRSDVSV